MTIESTNDNTPTTPAITYSECYAQVFSRLFLGDCLIESDKIENGSVDLILTDLPYGIVKMKESAGNYKVLNTAETWDKAIDPKSIYEIANRILRKNGKMILFSQEPYTSRMITEAIPNVPFSYRAVWEKNDFANGLGVNKAMVSFYEDILIFSKTHDLKRSHPLIDYFMQAQFCVPLIYGKDKKYKSNILKYKKDYNGYHPTQKPILLLEDLIKTFSNENNLVVDLTMGSGSTGVACKNTNRSFIGIEKDENYFKIAEQRINARTLFS
jgi:DNA modification methylase